IGTTFAIGDFDGDGRQEIVAGDQEGDLFIYEATDDDHRGFALTWVGQIDANNAHHLAAGNLQSSTHPQFVVGGQSADDFDLPTQHWIFVIFRSTGNDSYEAIWTQRIREVRSGGNGVAVLDTGRAFHQLAIAVWPNFYLFEYTGADFSPIWHHSASSTFRPVAADIDADGQSELLFNNAEALTVFGFGTDRKSLLVPWGITATAINETSIRLEWQAFLNHSYTVFRGVSENELSVHKTGIPQTPLRNEPFPKVSFTDEGLQTGQTYWYGVAASDGVGNLSDLSPPVSVMPTAPPRLIAAEYAVSNRILLRFDKPMGTSAAQPNHYRLNELASTRFHQPRSALIDQSSRRVIATFEAGVLRPLAVYEIRAENLRDMNGALIAADANTLTLTVPQPARITDLSAAIVYPNPVRGDRVVFDRLPPETEIQIYDVAGSQIAFLTLTPNDQGRKIWVFHQSDQTISSGTYVYVLEVGSERRTGKLSVIR
ncbi:MAG: T9SS type A sorting domain-containing protein, partial [Candidatus Poribacteria bacterium]|nr:T9SS type A sorting domain-containing protein [Candidatus Poribacteria bacterium]